MMISKNCFHGLLAVVVSLTVMLVTNRGVAADADAESAGPVFELRTYHTNEGKLDDLHARFRDHTVGLFIKHGMTNVAYWVPTEGEGAGKTLVYLMQYPSLEARAASWKAFLSDPDWKAAYAASTAQGKLVAKVDSVFLKATEWSPKVDAAAQDPARLFELRQYTTNEGKLDDLHARFRDHTIGLFEKHGMTNLWYFEVVPAKKEGGPPPATTLIYFLAHKDAEARASSFDAFRNDPDWKAAAKASEADGKILIKGGVQSTLLQPVDYSPIK
jgi:hypothetical protein